MKKVVLVGAGGRARGMFALPLATELKGVADFCGVYDINPVRAKRLSEECGQVTVFPAFEAMLAATDPDIVVVATADHTHHTYIIAALEAGCDVVSEKPMTIDAEKSKAIREAEQRTGRTVTVTFNLRFVPYFARVKQLLNEQVIGEIYHVDLEWALDRDHGADYFRRWHAELEHSGGLLVHKSTHHFDIINWWLDSHPEQVHAFGDLRFYGPNREERGIRCATCEFASSCEFYVNIAEDDFKRRYYVEAEKEDGYIRDQCVFGERINIYDTMSVHVKFESGALLTYSLVAYSPVEGWRAVIHGSKGRLELENRYRGPDADKATNRIRLLTPDGETVDYLVPQATGGHGGGDERLRNVLFAGEPDRFGQQAGSLAGAMSLLIGAAANRSIVEGKPIRIRDLV